ncbi:MAG: exo-alpha-sialidase [Fimbriimonadaceae bacterium]|nr:exo-alpha-sialidase [Fimbriimonadaceae bacterium]QYK58709.1 MAG: exo-alpha-sialidase [Fimbriimonadaceae bacterium]
MKQQFTMSRTGLTALAALACGLASAQNVIVGSPIRVDPGRGTFAANETSSASAGPGGTEIVTSWNDWSESVGTTEIIRCGVAVSSNAGATWSDFTLRPPVNNRSSVEGDPFAVYDNRTGNVWVGAISFAGNGGVYIARKTPGVNTFDNPVMVQASGSADKVWGAAGPIPGNQNTTRMYVAYNLGVARSNDLGSTWQAPVSLGSGLGFNPRVGPEGNVYVSFWNFSNQTFQLRRSLDGGNTYLAAQTLLTRVGTWGTGDCPIIPGNFRIPALPCIAVDPVSGVVYSASSDSGNLVGSNRNCDTFFQKSTDGGATWTSPVPLFRNTTLSRDHFFPWIEVDRSGRIHMLYYSTEAVSQNDTNTASCIMDAWYAFSDDGGDTWERARLTPVSFDGMNDGLARSMAFYGDYLGVAWGGQRVYPHYVASWPNNDPDNYVNVVINPFTVATAVSTFGGLLEQGNLDSLAQVDSRRYVVRNGPAFAFGAPNAGASMEFVTGVTSLTSLSVELVGSCTASPSASIEQKIELLNVQTNQWETVDVRAPAATDTKITVNVGGNVSRFFDSGQRLVKARIGWRQTGPTASGVWRGQIDRFLVIAR